MDRARRVTPNQKKTVQKRGWLESPLSTGIGNDRPPGTGDRKGLRAVHSWLVAPQTLRSFATAEGSTGNDHPPGTVDHKGFEGSTQLVSDPANSQMYLIFQKKLNSF